MRIPLWLSLAAPLLASCYTQAPQAAVAWNDREAIIAAPSVNVSGNEGYLRVETDTDLRTTTSIYYNLRRPYDIYAADGRLLRADVDNQGGRSGEEPRTVPLAPGRYVIASVYGTTYRKVQVDIRPGATTDVPQNVLQTAPRVFADGTGESE